MITEIAPDIFRLSTFVPDFNLQFNQFLVRDEESLLFHTGMKMLFPFVREEVAKLLPPEKIKWIGFSHFEADECGSLPEWQQLAPDATPVCSLVGKLVSVDDFALRPARPLSDGETFSTGKYNFRFLQTPHVPHCWEASLLFEETTATFFCSDLFAHGGDVEATTSADIVGRNREALIAEMQSPFAYSMPYTNQTDRILQSLAALKPQTLALMHGSTFNGDGETAILDLAGVLKEVIGAEN